MSDLVRELRAKAQQSTRTDKRWDDHVAWRGANEIERLSAANAGLLKDARELVDATDELFQIAKSELSYAGEELTRVSNAMNKLQEKLDAAEGTE